MFDYSTIPSGYYDEIFHRKRGPQSKWHHLKFREIVSLLKGCKAHLDIGSGPGTLIGLLPPGSESIGVDLAAEQIVYANKAYATSSKRFLRVEGYPYPFRDASFDAITAIELIEHLTIDEIRLMFDEAYRLLAPGGTLIVSTPNYASLWPALEKIVDRLTPVSYEHQHITRFTSERLAELMRSAGFHAVRCRPYQGFAFMAGAIHWRLPDFLSMLERRLTWRRYGLLLIAVGTKPACQ